MKKIEFYSDVYGLADTVPILKTSEALPKWVNTVRADYKQNQKEKTHLYRCPGIFDLFTTGYIVTSWHDMTIHTDGENYRWEIPSQELAVLMEASQLAQSHSHHTIGKYLPRPNWAHPSVLKINTPWHVVAPKNVKFLITQVPYPDSFEFTALNGILDPGISTEVNIQLNWNIPRGSYTIKAGTPLAQLIPLSEENFELVVRDKNKHDEIWSLKRRFFNNMSFVLNRSRIKKMYDAHFNHK
jgi:hypothetical protein